MIQCLCDEREWGTQNGVNLRHRLFISGIFNLIFWDCDWPEAVEITDKGGYCIRKEKPAALHPENERFPLCAFGTIV